MTSITIHKYGNFSFSWDICDLWAHCGQWCEQADPQTAHLPPARTAASLLLCTVTLSVICNVIVNVLNVFTPATPVTFLLLVSPANVGVQTNNLAQLFPDTCDKSAPNIENLNGSTKNCSYTSSFFFSSQCTAFWGMIASVQFWFWFVCLRDYCQQSCPRAGWCHFSCERLTMRQRCQGRRHRGCCW